MSAPALKISQTTSEQTVKSALTTKPPLMNERVSIYRYEPIHLMNGEFLRGCDIIGRCGLVAEVSVAADGKSLVLYAARRRPRNKHD